MMEGLQISIPQRMMLVRITLVVSLIISLCLSPALWFGNRPIPFAPLIERDMMTPAFDLTLTIVALLCWAASLFLKKQRIFIFVAFLISVALVFLDVNRLQPWFYIYQAMLLVFVFYNGRVDDSNRFTSYFILLQIIIASVYFFCGLSQLNAVFVDSDFEEVVAPLRQFVSERQFLFFKKLGTIIPYVLMFVGIGLVISPIRYLAITLAIFIHFVLLIFLFPSKLHQNYSLWFSNLAFMIMIILLFSGKTKQRYFSPTFLFQLGFFYPVAALFIIMPFFNNSERWPDYLSSNFKSGNNVTAIISLSQNAADNLPPELKEFCTPSYGFLMFNYRKWFLSELKVDCFPGPVAFTSVYNYLLSTQKGLVKEIELQVVPSRGLLLKP